MRVATAWATLPPDEVYNVGTGQQTTLKQVVETTREILQITAEPAWASMQARAWDTNTWVANNTKLRAAGWMPEFDFHAGFLKTIEWYRMNQPLIERYYLK